MDEDKFNMSVRKFLKVVGVTSQREIEKAVHEAIQAGRLRGDERLQAKVTLTIDAVGLAHVVEDTIELEALRLYGLSKHAPALLCGTLEPLCQREFAAEVAWDLPNLTPGATSLLDLTVIGCRQRRPGGCDAGLLHRFIELDAGAWTSNTVRVMAQNISLGATFDLAATTLSAGVTR
jgi:Family of unknown function (DUF6494)